MKKLFLLASMVFAMPALCSGRRLLMALKEVKTGNAQKALKALNSLPDTHQKKKLITVLLEQYGDELEFKGAVGDAIKTLSPNDQKDVRKAIETYRKRTWVNQEPIGKDILLLINFNFPHYKNIPKIRALYAEHFPNIVFYGEAPHPEVQQLKHDRGFLSYHAIAHAMEKFPNYKGYLFVHDDVILNFWNFVSFDIDKIWYSAVEMVEPLAGPLSPANGWWGIWDGGNGRDHVEKMYHLIPKKNKDMLTRNCGGQNKVIGAFSDIAYVPRRYKDDFISVSTLFYNAKVHLEIATPMILCAIENKENFHYFDGLALWYGDRDHAEKFYHEDLDYIHAIKMSDAKLWSFIEKQIAKNKNRVPGRFPLIKDNRSVRSYLFNRPIPRHITS